jgi:oxalate decarboxylase/phosphoglucose isomerase-like protein (cupin superfamily)
MRRSLAALAGVLLFFAAAVSGGADERLYTFPHVTPDPHPMRILGPAGEIFAFIKSCATTKNTYAMATATIPVGAGPIPHVHHYTDEWFYFPDGGLTLVMGEQRYPVTSFVAGKNAPKDRVHLIKTHPGDIYYGPRYIIHGFFNDTSEVHHLTFVWAPDDGVTDYFRQVGQHITDPAHIPAIAERNKELFASEAPKYGINQSTSYPEYVEGIDRSPMPPMDKHLDELTKLLTTTPAAPAKTKIPCNSSP